MPVSEWICAVWSACGRPARAKLFVEEFLPKRNCLTRREKNCAPVILPRRTAFAKATGLGLAKLGLRSVSVRHDAVGRPILVLDPQAPALEPYRRARFHLSLSHDRGIAAAVVIYETEGV